MRNAGIANTQPGHCNSLVISFLRNSNSNYYERMNVSSPVVRSVMKIVTVLVDQANSSHVRCLGRVRGVMVDAPLIQY